MLVFSKQILEKCHVDVRARDARIMRNKITNEKNNTYEANNTNRCLNEIDSKYFSKYFNSDAILLK